MTGPAVPRFADVPAVPYFFVRTKLPEGGLEELFEKPITPLLNAAMAAVRPAPGQDSLPEGMFSLHMMCQLPNLPEFLALLGKPLAIAEDLEARPGVWWLSTADGQHDVIIFSDSHRKNHWKGGQLCVSTSSGGRISPLSLPVLALAKSCQALLGPSPPPPQDRFFEVFLDGRDKLIQARTANPDLAWPKWSERLPAQDLTVLAKAARAGESAQSVPPPRRAP